MLLKYLLFAGVFASLMPYAHAGVIVGGSRVVYEANKKEVALSVKNPEEKNAYLIQTWVDNELQETSTKAPFIITPPLFRLDAGQENLLRIFFAGKKLPMDRESVFWLNIKSIPSVEKSDTNRLLISVNTRIKLFYRPDKLEGEPGDAYKKLVFFQKDRILRISNPTPYYVSFRELSVGGKKINDAGMVAPKSELSHTLPEGLAGKVTWKAINDYGGVTAEAAQ
ncbi:molecular chaperone [Pseudomonas sp. D47]|uniref:fimbrial biogenesis chaperone n=1 Tax=Pseudomonas sp. D47 TaxID=3159447 RepID=UPI00387A87CC